MALPERVCLGTHTAVFGTPGADHLSEALDEGRVGKDQRVVLFNCGTGLKYDMPAVTGFIDRNQPIDYDAL